MGSAGGGLAWLGLAGGPGVTAATVLVVVIAGLGDLFLEMIVVLGMQAAAAATAGVGSGQNRGGSW